MNEFCQKMGIITGEVKHFNEAALEYKFNSCLPSFQDVICNDLKAAIQTAQKGFIEPRVLKAHTRSLRENLRPEYISQLLTLYRECLKPQGNYFYFGGIGCGLKVQPTLWPFTNGFSFCAWVNVNEVEFAQKVLSIHATGQSGGGGFECFIIRGSAYYRILSSIYSEPTLGSGAVFIGALKQGWNFIAVSHEVPRKFQSAHLTTYFNTEAPKVTNLDYPKMHSDALVDRFYICENLFGLLQCCIVMNQSSSKVKDIQKIYAAASMTLKQIKTLPSVLEKYFERIMSIYIPEMGGSDMIGTYHGTLMPRSGIVLSNNMQFNQYGGFKLWFCLLHYSCTIYKQASQAQQNVGYMFEILNNALRNNEALQTEAANRNIWITISAIIQNAPTQVLGQKAIEMLIDMKSLLFNIKLIDQFFVTIWNSGFQSKASSEQLFSKILSLGSQFYLQNAAHFQHLVSFKDLLDSLVFGFQDYCCNQHYAEHEPTYQIALFEKMLYLFNQVNDINENIAMLEEYISVKMPPCLLIQIFNIIRQLLIGQADGVRMRDILQQWNQNDIIKSLLFLFKSQFSDIRSRVITLLHLVFQQQFPQYEQQLQEAIEFISANIEELTEIQPVVEINDLKNLGTQFLNNDYESVPVAPSMTNRRKPADGFFERRPTARAQSIPVQEKPKPKSTSVETRKKLKIDTEAINSLYSYGGEKGKKNEFDKDAFDYEMREILDLARQCVRYMDGFRDVKEQYVLPKTKVPQTTKNSQAPQSMQFDLNPIAEQSSVSMPEQKRYQKCHSLYASLLSWLIDKLSIEPIMIEESDVIAHPGILTSILKLYECSHDDDLRAQILQDLLCITKCDTGNSILIVGQQNCHVQLLNILKNAQKENQLNYEIGHRLYVTLLTNILSREYIGADYISEALRWSLNQLDYDQLLAPTLVQLNQVCRLYQPSLNQPIWRNVMSIGLNILIHSDRLTESKVVYRQILSYLFKETTINTNQTIENQFKQIQDLLTNGLQQIYIGTAEVLNSQVQNTRFYEIVTQLLSPIELPQLLFTYGFVSEFYQGTSPDSLLLIFFKLMNSGNAIQTTQHLFMLVHLVLEKNQCHGYVYGMLSKIIEDIDEHLELLLARSFDPVLIQDLLHTFKIPQNLQISQFPLEVLPFQAWQTQTLVDIGKVSKQIQFHGEMRLIQCEERRQLWLQVQSDRDRQGKHTFRQYCKRMLSFDSWLAPRDFFAHSQKDRDEADVKYFKYRVCNWITRDLIRPFLTCKMNIPDDLIIKGSINFGNNIRRTQIEQVPIATNKIKDTIKIITQQKTLDISFFNKKVQVIKSLCICNGFLTLDFDTLIFQHESLRQEQSHVSLEQFVLKEHSQLSQRWPINLIEMIIKKKYLQKRSALEIYFVDGRSLFINVPDANDLNEIAQKLLKLRKSDKCTYFKQEKTTDPIKLMEHWRVTQKWISGQMSNLKYLSVLNALSSRSFRDLTQYPVMPWILREIGKVQESTTPSKQVQIYPDGCFRDLSLTMGTLGSKYRIKSYLERFEQASVDIPAFHYGSHYSSPAITSQYLIRLEPFTTASKIIQGGKFDVADRLFYSIEESFRCATEDVADVRELIPELFCLPEMFLNLQSLNFGKTQTGMKISDVILPKWCHYNPYKYIVGMRNALENQEVNEWIDLIFGFKQRGKEADQCLNKFFYLTYDNLIDWDKVEMKLSVETQIVNFGITPSQLFSRQHQQRQNPQDKFVTHWGSELKVYRPPNKKKHRSGMSQFVNACEADPKAIVYIRWLSDVKIVCLRRDGKIDTLKWGKQENGTPFSCAHEKSKQLALHRLSQEPFTLWDYSLKSITFPIAVINQTIVQGGFVGGRLLVQQNDQNTFINIHTSTICAIKVEKNDKVMITADISGHVILWQITPDYKFILIAQYFDHQSQVNFIAINRKLRLFATCCQAGYIHIYNLYSGVFFRSIKHPNSCSINAIVLASQPMPCLVFQSQQDRIIYSYSINGAQLESFQEQCCSMVDCQIIRNQQFSDILVYGTETGEIVMRALPFLQQFKRFPISTKAPVLAISRSKDKKFLLCGCDDGEISVMAEQQLK